MNRIRSGVLLIAWVLASLAGAGEIQTLPNTNPLTVEGDIASLMVDGIDRFLLKEIDASIAKREAFWKRDFSSPEAYDKSIEPNRNRLAHILGLRDARVPFSAPELIATTEQPALVGKADTYEIFAIRWPVLSDPQPDRKMVSLHGEGLLIVPTGREPVADVVAIPHCDNTPEQICGLTPGVPPEEQHARILAELGCRVVIPTLIDRNPHLDGLMHREFLYRAAFEVGRQLTGYELQKIFAAVDWLAQSKRRIGVIGYGDGGMLALYAGALDTRIQAVCVNGYFAPREHMWEEPLDRNTFGRLVEFGEGELAAMIAPRSLVIGALAAPEFQWVGGLGGPAKIATPDFAAVQAELLRAKAALPDKFKKNLFAGTDWPAVPVVFRQMIQGHWSDDPKGEPKLPQNLRKNFNPAARHATQFNEILRHTEGVLVESTNVRNAFVKPLLDAAAKGPAEYEKAAAIFRKKFYDEVIGRFDKPLKDFNARTRKSAESEKWTRYEVMLDVFDDVFAYGLLIVPKDIKEGERRPVVVCQHGLEGRPKDIVEGDNKAYHDFATKIAERGYITFSPQNPYIFKDRFRALQRKANPLGKTLFSIIVPQHQQIVNWLKTLPQADPERIGFYGLSYGGKTAMRVPAIITDYKLSICSADFNEWVWKNASTSTFAKPYTYANKNEYEIFEWDLGSTFNYAEMAMLIAPRPFMVERGHFDGVAPDETVAWEFARVKRFYTTGLKMPERARIEWFPGPHTINGVGTFEFLDEWLRRK